MTRLWSSAWRAHPGDAPAKRLKCDPTISPIHGSIAQFRWNVQTGACWWSEGFRKLWAFDPDEPVSVQLARARQHPDDRARLDDERSHLLNEGGAYETTFRIVLPDGSTKWIFSTGFME